MEVDKCRGRDTKRPALQAPHRDWDKIISDNVAHNKSKCRILVDDLPDNVAREDLESLFREAGATSEIKVCRNRQGTGSSAEIVFVRHIDASLAIMKFNMKEIEGRQVKVSRAKDRQETIPQGEVKVDLRAKLDEKQNLAKSRKRRYVEEEGQRWSPKRIRLEKNFDRRQRFSNRDGDREKDWHRERDMDRNRDRGRDRDWNKIRGRDRDYRRPPKR